MVWCAGQAHKCQLMVQSFLIGKMVREIGQEARSQNKSLLLGPTVNITRIP